ncbi:MAG: hypothetical protein J6C85_04020 [Alphaproteobacteria bacterium]|nr:hypothetical protein [Alphaproteobacteria bacterium]
MVKGVMTTLCFCVLMAVSAAVYYKKSEEMARESSALYKQNNEILYSKLREAYENNVKIEKTRKALERAAREDKTAFDWGADISHSPVILRLQAD